jgi:hypothetical protein
MIDSSMSVNDFNHKGIQVYPNPVQNELVVQNDNNLVLTSIQISDLTGKVVLEQNLDAVETNQLSVAALTKGIYLVTIEGVNGRLLQTKLIKE